MTAKLHLNIKPTTLATWDPDIYLNLWKCASQRARLAQDPEVATAEYESANALYEIYQQRKEPAYSPSLPDGIIKYSDDPRFDRLLIDRSEHIARSMNGKPIAVPDYLSEAICDDDHSWNDKLATWLEVNDDDNRLYTYSEITVGSGSCNDLQGEINMVYFYLDDGKDQYYKGFYMVIDGLVYNCTDSTIADCGILDDTIGWYLTDIQGDELPEECETYRLAVGYSNNPTNELDKIRDGRSEPIWHWGLNCFVGRIESWPHPVRMYPELMLR